MGDEEAHGDVLTKLMYSSTMVSDGLGHHVRIQVGIILPETEAHTVLEATVPAFQQNTHRVARKHVAEAGCGNLQEAPLAFREAGPGMLNTCKADLPH